MLDVTRQACGLFEESHKDEAAGAHQARPEHQEMGDGSGGVVLIIMQSKMESSRRDLSKESYIIKW